MSIKTLWKIGMPTSWRYLKTLRSQPPENLLSKRYFTEINIWLNQPAMKEFAYYTADLIFDSFNQLIFYMQSIMACLGTIWLCTYSFERSLNDDKVFSFKTKSIIMSVFRAFQIYNLLSNIPYFLI